MAQEEGKEKKAGKRVWAVNCLICETTVDLDIGDFKIISTDQGAEFIRVPRFICGKCKSECTVELVES